METLISSPKSAVQNQKDNSPGDGISSSSRHGAWSFQQVDVCKAFDIHASKSIPLYHEGHELVAKLSDFYLGDGSRFYEIGCSTGTLSKKIFERAKNRLDVEIIGIDPSASMIEIAEQNTDELSGMKFYCCDAVHFDFEPSDMIVMYYVCQFIQPKYRLGLMKKIYESLNPGGALILFEKVREENSQHNDYISQIYMDFKTEQGYSCEEILTKTKSLKGVLKSFTNNMNLELLKEAGFKVSNITPIMKHLQFEGILVTK